MRFDEVELEPVTFDLPEPAPPPAAALSLFAALGLALSPLLPASVSWLTIAGLGGVVALVSYYYFVGSWTLWGKTIGGTIFDLRVPRMSLPKGSPRWLLLCGVLLAAGAGVLVYVKA